MPRLSDDERRAALLTKKAQLEKQLKAISARASAKNKRESTRRKILIGAAVMLAFEKGDAPFLRDLLNRYVSRPPDRDLLKDLMT